MNLWIVNQYAVPPDRMGGTRHYTLAKYLAKLGWNSTIIAGSFDHVSRKETVLNGKDLSLLKDENGVPFLWLRTFPYMRNDWKRMWNMVSFGRQALRTAPLRPLSPPDAVIGSSPHLFGALAAERLARKHKVPFVLEIRDLWPESLVQLAGYSPRHPVVRGLQKIEHYLYRRADLILTLLRYSKDYIVKAGGNAERIHWLPNGIDLASSPCPSQSIDHSNLKVFYTGSIGQANGLDTLLDAGKLLHTRHRRDIEIHIVGNGPELDRLRKRVDDESIPNVFLPGPVARSEVSRILKEASACVITLMGAGLFELGVSPNKLYDYMAAGRPIIFSVQAARNDVTEANCGFAIPPANPVALADVMERLAGMSPMQRAEMGQRGRAFVEQHHSYDKLAERLALHLDRLCPREKVPSGQHWAMRSLDKDPSEITGPIIANYLLFTTLSRPLAAAQGASPARDSISTKIK